MKKYERDIMEAIKKLDELISQNKKSKKELLKKRKELLDYLKEK